MFSLIMPMDADRLKQFANTKRVYDAMPQKKEFLIPTRSREKLEVYLDINHLSKDVRLLPYTIDGDGFNCSKALNIGVRSAKYKNIIITSPEVKPTTDVLEQLSKCKSKNIICEVSDQDESGNLTILVSKTYRGDNPSMYFLAMFQKRDIEKINGWDEEFMKGYAYEDNDFGERWVRAGIPFEVREDIKAVHQYHPRSETISGGLNTNFLKYQENNANGVIRCKKGLVLE